MRARDVKPSDVTSHLTASKSPDAQGEKKRLENFMPRTSQRCSQRWRRSFAAAVKADKDTPPRRRELLSVLQSWSSCDVQVRVTLFVVSVKEKSDNNVDIVNQKLRGLGIFY